MTTIRRLITLTIAATTSMFAASVAAPAAFASRVAPPATGGTTTPVGHHVVAASGPGGMLGWEVALIAIGSALFAALLTVGVDRFTINRRLAHRVA